LIAIIKNESQKPASCLKQVDKGKMFSFVDGYLKIKYQYSNDDSYNGIANESRALQIFSLMAEN